MSVNPESTESEATVHPTINMAPGQSAVISQVSGLLTQYQSFDPEAPSPFIGQQVYPSHFDVSYQNNNVTAQELVKRLDSGWYLCYKYFVVIVGIIEIFTACNYFGMLFFPFRGNETIIFMHVFTAIWDIHQLYTIYQAMHLKSFDLAEQAVHLMQICMVILALGTILQFAQAAETMRDHNGNRLSVRDYIFGLIIEVGLVEGVFYLFYYFGANKVRGILSQIYSLESKNTHNSQVSVHFNV